LSNSIISERLENKSFGMFNVNNTRFCSFVGY
jgi:hypothetical protein